MCEQGELNIAAAIEAILFSNGASVERARIAQALEITEDEVENQIAALTDDYIITDPVLINIFGYDRTVVVVEVSTTETTAQSSLYYTITLLMNMPLKRLRKWMSLHSRRSVRSTE